ncbi:hypothetical protein [Thermoanaerobacterium sp. RBIITD]|uniref:hypothetical protein n=1 Tax=Thermoanaerobacterium sp. RBIITD TaxID=1550240 RepID=UPI000BB950D3|nr:hypothetical protein [Thermoanaerobacterium sp. RBIITD]SNX54172.1 hypothetical protein SAMN05660242_1806 [Thermoanaerobacterium sp. RBIITD]
MKHSYSCQFTNTGLCLAQNFQEYLHCVPEKCQYLKGHLARRYWGEYAGDTGKDNGIFNAGAFTNLNEAIQAVKEGLSKCQEPYWGIVVDLLTNQRIPVNL